ncbi:MAG: flagellar biosynthesis protein FlhB [Syntrophales bacterium]
MAENDQDQERTEQASPRRKEEARKKGQVAKSQEIASVAILVACLTYFYFGAAGMMHKMMALVSRYLREAGTTVVDKNSVQGLIFGMAYEAFVLVMPLLLIVVAAGLLANYLQVGFVFSSETLLPKYSKIDPFKGFQRLMSLKSMAELAKNIMKLVIVGTVAYWTIAGEIDGLIPLVDESIWGILIYIGNISFKIIFRTCWVLIVLAVLDYIYQRWEYERGLKMTKQEVKDEFKQTEGEPLVKARIRRLQREVARKRMMAKVPKADVVITNPDHISVALMYDKLRMSAPVVVAKGAGFIAEKIKELARKNDVPIVENKPLARLLYRTVELNAVIPENLYRAVAEVLAYVYGLRRKQMTETAV